MRGLTGSLHALSAEQIFPGRKVCTRCPPPLLQLTWLIGCVDTNVHSSVWLGSMAVVKNDEQVTAVHKFEQLMDPNNIARAIVPRPINNFMDRLPTEERFAAEVSEVGGIPPSLWLQHDTSALY